MVDGLIKKFKTFIGDYGMKEQHGVTNKIMNSIVSSVIGYNHCKYWKRREYVVDSTRKNLLKKFCICII